jgi:hypothetical protein
MLVSKDKEKKQVVKTRRENGSVYLSSASRYFTWWELR